jgi:hypothetical protein
MCDRAQQIAADALAIIALAERNRALLSQVEQAVLQAIADSLRRRALETAQASRT